LFHAHGDIVLLVPIAAGIAAGPERGATAGFAAGLLVDLVVTTPFGLFALTYCLTGYAVGALQAGVLRATWWLPVAAAAAGSALGVVLFALVATVLGVEGLLDADLGRAVAAVALPNAVLVLPALRVVRWLESSVDTVRPVLR
ncbi:MAG: rod shape-determining protein MreD, partial [Acidimicrobiales bacterium]